MLKFGQEVYTSEDGVFVDKGKITERPDGTWELEFHIRYSKTYLYKPTQQEYNSEVIQIQTKLMEE